jgi:hypothetical protein
MCFCRKTDGFSQGQQLPLINMERKHKAFQRNKQFCTNEEPKMAVILEFDVLHCSSRI